MIDINSNNKINLKKIFGINKKTGNYFFDEWKEEYPVIMNEDVFAWIRDKIDKYTQTGKPSNKFSITTYLKPLQQYCGFNEVKNPSDLLEEELDNRNARVRTYIDFLLSEKSDKNKLKSLGFNKKPSEITVRNMIQSRIKSFYSARGKPITYGIKTATSGENKREIILTKSMIKKIKSKLESPEYRLIVKFQTQLGLRIGDVLEVITSGKYNIEKYKDHYFIKNFRTYKIGTVINYLFFTDELTNLIQSIYGIEDLTKLDLTSILKTNRDTAIKKLDYLSRLKEVVSDLGIKENIKTHSFRKYFSSQVRKCKQVDDEFKEHLMGHASYNLSQSYNNNLKDINWVYEQWLKLENLVCVDCIVYDKTNKEVLKLKEENIKLKEQVDILLKAKIDTEKEIESVKETFTGYVKKFKFADQMLDIMMDVYQEEHPDEGDEEDEDFDEWLKERSKKAQKSK